MTFDKIMEGFMQAQIAAQKRGDFSPDAGVEYLNGACRALEQTLLNGANDKWDSVEESQPIGRAIGEPDICAED